MVVQLLIGGAASACNIMLHALVMAVVIKVTRAQASKISVSDSRWFLIRVMVASVSVLMAAHMLEVAFWSQVYWLVGAAPGADLLYFAFVNYTTLGYGDITPVKPWRLLGPLTAMNGILLFGWSTAVIFEVLRRTLMRMDQISH